MALNRVYEMSADSFRRRLDRRKLELWQDLFASQADDCADHWFVPYDNWKEAERRVDFISAFLKEYSKQLHSKLPLKAFVHNLNKKLERLQAEKMQISFFPEDTSKSDEEIKKIIEIKDMIRTFPQYFDEMHFSSYKRYFS